MNTVADSLFSALMSWVRALVNSIWAIFSSERTTILEFLGKNWLLIVAALIAFGLVADWLIWLLRWQPYHLWAQRARRLLRIADPEEDEDDEPRARAATVPERRKSAPAPRQEQNWLPLAEPMIDEEDERQAMRQAESVPDASLGVYPGMRYDDSRAAEASMRDLGDTQRFAAVHSEGPGAAEVARRRAEIDAWQQQLQDEARAKAEAEQARLLREAQEAEAARRAAEAEQARLQREAEEERMRLAWEAAEAERIRREQEAAEAQRARQAQEQYERELAEYERQKAQYERELAEYERQKAAYDAEMARLAAQEAQQQEDEQSAQRRRRAAQSVEPLMEEEQEDEKTARRDGRLMDRMARMAQMLEPEQTEVSGIRSLPPRVDPRDAYGPATRPRKPGRRRK